MVCTLLPNARLWERRIPSFKRPKSQKNPRVRKIFCPQFWGRKWLRQFYGRLEKCVLSAGKPMSIKFLLLGGGGFWGGECRFCFYGRKDFCYQNPKDVNSENSNYCLIVVWEFVSSRRQTTEVCSFCGFKVFEQFCPTSRAALTGCVGDAQDFGKELHTPTQSSPGDSALSAALSDAFG